MGVGEASYNCIVDAFWNDRMRGFARVIMACSLHKKLPCLVVRMSCICNSFDAKWVRDQWIWIEKLWVEECAPVVGSVVGYASDGDTRHRQLMLVDYLHDQGERFIVY